MNWNCWPDRHCLSHVCFHHQFATPQRIERNTRTQTHARIQCCYSSQGPRGNALRGGGTFNFISKCTQCMGGGGVNPHPLILGGCCFFRRNRARHCALCIRFGELCGTSWGMVGCGSWVLVRVFSILHSRWYKGGAKRYRWQTY